jgi:uncharacterized protein (TIGR00730 family)
MKRVCVYCGSSPGARDHYQLAAKQLANELVHRDMELIYGGASVGIMGTLADAVLDAGGNATGVMPRALVEKEIAHPNLTHLHVVESMHERKALMETLADGFIALPGGLGTLEEMFEMLTWGQLGYHEKPCGFLNIENYYRSLAVFLDNLVQEQFLKTVHRSMILMANEPKALLNAMQDYRPPKIKKWITRDAT